LIFRLQIPGSRLHGLNFNLQPSTLYLYLNTRAFISEVCFYIELSMVLSTRIPIWFYWTYLRSRILVQNQGGREYQTGGILL